MDTVRYGCRITTLIDDLKTKQEMWEVYRLAFEASQDECIQDQICYSEETFAAALLDPDYLKFVTHADGRTTGLALCTSNLDKARVTYMNPRRLRKLYPDQGLLYTTAIAVRPEIMGKRAGTAIIKAIGSVLDEQDLAVVFDFSTEKNLSLPDLIIRSFRTAQDAREWKTTSSEFTPLGGQVYGVIKLT